MICNESRLVTEQEAFYNLANAVVERAAIDYRYALQGWVLQNSGITPQSAIIQLESFFRSQWFTALTTLDGEQLMQLIRDDVAGKQYKRPQRKGRL